MTHAQQELDDEILSACHDGELPSTDAEAVRRRLAREPELAERLRAMQYVDAAAAGAFRARDAEPLPAHTLELLHAAEQEQRERRRGSGNVVHLQPRSAHDAGRRWSAVIGAAMSAVLRRFRAQFSRKS